MSDDKRDQFVRKTPPAGVRAQSASPEPIWDDATKKHERGEIDETALWEARRKRSPSRRLEFLEDQFVSLEKVVSKTAVTADETALAVAELKGHLDGQDTVLEDIRLAVKDRQTVHTTATMAQIDVFKEQAKAQIADDTDAKKIERADTFDAHAARRKLVLMIAGSVFSAGALLELIKWVAGKF